MNPIFVEYYSHENTDCYKVKLPWTKYNEEKQVLCRVDEGYGLAKRRAGVLLFNHLKEALSEPIK